MSSSPKIRRPIVLSGFMATGKSTLGAAVAERLGVPFVDTDAVLADAAKTSVGALFSELGEAQFRDREAAVALPLLADGTPRVIAFGGGTVTIPRVRYAALEAATVVTLAASPETVVSRVASLAGRPNLGGASPVDRARDLVALRREAYAECHAEIDTEKLSMEQAVDAVIDVAGRDLLAVPLGSRSYVVELGLEQPEMLTAALAGLSPSSLVTVTDSNVRAARGAWLERALAPTGLRNIVVELAPGEEHKTIDAVRRIWDAALEGGADRKAVVLAFGGGVVGDLAGFAASTLLRGVRCVQTATTLLAMVDSSVGGKTGFDHAAGKNLVGSFFQPSRVILDLAQLSTLDPRQRASGVAEIVKIALARDAAFFDRLERDADAIATGEPETLRDVVREAVLAKIRVVREDERETGPRALLNLGHTVGHALEAHGRYAALLHGEAVSVGVVLELEATERLGLTEAGLAARVRALLSRFGLPVDAPRETVEAAWPFVSSDKKRTSSDIALPVVHAVGRSSVERVALATLRDAVLR